MRETAEVRKSQAKAWFESLRDDICASFEAIEDDIPAGVAETLGGPPPGRFERQGWVRSEGG
ncbi:MAG: coproporphyrinogen III oxidase, partial [Alphaproteobacteria bacterium]|nr:coproporphyrinogen III oxidase [Alphaproteobacteria bacterium]